MKSISLLVFALLSIGGATAQSLRGNGNANKFRPAPPDKRVASSYIIRIHDSVPDVPGKATALAAVLGGTVQHIYSIIPAMSVTTDMPVQALQALLGEDNEIQYVEEDQMAQANSVGSWGLDRIDQTAPPLDDSYTPPFTGAGVHAYVLDTGTDLNHVELPNVVCGTTFISGTDPCGSDDQYHGTHCSGTIASTTYGVAKDTTIVPVKVLDSEGSGSMSGVIAGLDWVQQNHIAPAVASMSLGGGYFQSLNDAVDALVAGGVPVAVSAGNNNADASGYSPASAAAALTVASTDNPSSTGGVDSRSSFSNFGPAVDLFAPGRAITSTFPNDQTAIMSGTSMAAPHVAGALALLMGTGSGLSGAEAIAAVLNAASDVVDPLAAGTTQKLLYVEDPPTCDVPQCLTCDANDPQLCVSCNEGFFVDASGKCTACGTGCMDCSSANTCNTCEPGLSLVDGVCVDCPSSCTSCTSTGACDSCDTGFFLNGGQCTACGTGCMDCFGATACNTCEPGLSLVDGVCVDCPSSCASCTSTGACDSCNIGFYLSGGQCTACGTGCMDCSSATACNTCEPGLPLVGGVCVNCPLHCNSCLDSNTCIECEEGYVSVGGGSCDSCQLLFDENCSACTESGCTQCLGNLVLEQGECIEPGCAMSGDRCGSSNDCCFSDSLCIKIGKGPRRCS